MTAALDGFRILHTAQGGVLGGVAAWSFLSDLPILGAFVALAFLLNIVLAVLR